MMKRPGACAAPSFELWKRIVLQMVERADAI